MKLNLVSLFVLVLSLFSCTSVEYELREAERQMDAAPDSALKVLQQLNFSQISSRSEKALYALLFTQALDKKKLDITSDTLISIATSYYGETEPARAGYAWLFTARYAAYVGDSRQQASSLLKAQGYALLSKNRRLQSIIYGDKARLYQQQLLYDSTLHYLRKSYAISKATHNIKNNSIDLLEIGYVYLVQNKYDSASYYYMEALQQSEKMNDIFIRSIIYRSLGSLSLKKKEFEKAVIYYQSAPLTGNALHDSNTWYLLAKAYLMSSQLDSARHYLNKVTVLDEMAADYYKIWMRIYVAEKDYKQAYRYSSKAMHAQDSINKHRLEESFAGLEKKYNYQQLYIANQDLQIKNKQAKIIILIVILVLSTVLIFFLIWKNIVKQREITTEKLLLVKETERAEKERENKILLEKQLKFQSIMMLNVEQYRKNSLKKPENLISGYSPIDDCHFTSYQQFLAARYNGCCQ